MTLPLEIHQSGYKGKQVQEFLKQFAGLTLGRKSYEIDMGVTPILDSRALDGFSGAAYNAYSISLLGRESARTISSASIWLWYWHQSGAEAQGGLRIGLPIGRSQKSTGRIKLLGRRRNGRTDGKPSTIPILTGSSCRQRCQRTLGTTFQRICLAQTYSWLGVCQMRHKPRPGFSVYILPRSPGRSAGLKPNHPQPRALRHRLGSSLRIEFVEQRGDVKLYRMDRNREAPRDRLVRRALGDQRQHIEFARR